MWQAWVYRFKHGRDPRQFRFLTPAGLRWMLRHRAYTPWYLLHYWRLAMLRLRHPDVVLEGLVFLGRRVSVQTRPAHGRLILGRWSHVGDRTRLRAHEGTLRIGDKTVLGSDVTINCYLDIEIGAAGMVADWVYICDFDHGTADVTVVMKDQGLVKTPIRIGPDCWLGVKATVLRGTVLGEGCVLGANSVARGVYPPQSIVAGLPARVVADRAARYAARSAQREAMADMARRNAEAVRPENLGPVSGTPLPASLEK